MSVMFRKCICDILIDVRFVGYVLELNEDFLPVVFYELKFCVHVRFASM